jgi:hypothetical protein
MGGFETKGLCSRRRNAPGEVLLERICWPVGSAREEGVLEMGKYLLLIILVAAAK